MNDDPGARRNPRGGQQTAPLRLIILNRGARPKHNVLAIAGMSSDYLPAGLSRPLGNENRSFLTDWYLTVLRNLKDVENIYEHLQANGKRASMVGKYRLMHLVDVKNWFMLRSTIISNCTRIHQIMAVVCRWIGSFTPRSVDNLSTH